LNDETIRIKRNSLFAFGSSAVRLVANGILFIGIARFYGPKAFGQFTAAHTLSIIFLLLADFGFDVLLTSEIARNRRKTTVLVYTYLSMKIIFSLIGVSAMLLTTYLGNMSDSTKLLMYVLSFYVFFSALTNYFFALFKGFNEFSHETKITLLMNGFLIVTVFILGYIHTPLTMIAIAFVISRIIGLFFAIIIGNRFVSLDKFQFAFPTKEQFLMIAVFGFHAIFSTLFFVQDTILLSMWRGDREVGIYQAVFKLIAVVFVVPDVIMTALLPILSNYNVENLERWKTLGQMMNKTLFLIGLPIAAILFIYSEQIIFFLYGQTEYLEAIPVLRIFSVITFLHFSTISCALMLTTAHRQITRTFIVILATLLNYSLNYFMIPNYGPIGAAIVSLATILFVGICYAGAMRSFFIRWICNMHYAVPFVATLLTAIIMWHARLIPLWYIIIPFAGWYGIIFYFFGYTKQERALIFGSGKVSMLLEKYTH